jgi:hypothetical protein
VLVETRDEEEEPLKQVKHLFLKKKGGHPRYEIVNRFEEHFYIDIGANLLHQAGIKKKKEEKEANERSKRKR